MAKNKAAKAGAGAISAGAAARENQYVQRLIEDAERKLRALEAFSEQIVRGRWADVRPPSRKELKATTVLELPLAELSAKVRSGPPVDDEDDYARDTWAGIVPLALVAGTPEDDPRLRPGIAAPSYATAYSRPSRPG